MDIPPWVPVIGDQVATTWLDFILGHYWNAGEVLSLDGSVENPDRNGHDLVIEPGSGGYLPGGDVGSPLATIAVLTSAIRGAFDSLAGGDGFTMLIGFTPGGGDPVSDGNGVMFPLQTPNVAFPPGPVTAEQIIFIQPHLTGAPPTTDIAFGIETMDGNTTTRTVAGVNGSVEQQFAMAYFANGDDSGPTPFYLSQLNAEMPVKQLMTEKLIVGILGEIMSLGSQFQSPFAGPPPIYSIENVMRAVHYFALFGPMGLPVPGPFPQPIRPPQPNPLTPPVPTPLPCIPCCTTAAPVCPTN